MEPYRLRIIPRRWTSRLASSIVALAFITMIFSARNACAQTGGTSSDSTKVTWPHTFTLGFGGALNINSQLSGTAGTGDTNDPYGQYGYTSGSTQINPEFHILAEIPIATNWMFAPRIAYNNRSLSWNQQSTPAAGTTV